ncbi:hypothetical protein ACP70R_038296 [Stipagrostis hirtigluma subsp. patula]
MSTATVTLSVEYAKSGRSTCKGCSEAIAAGALRLGASAPDPRGFDATKWYHVACFPAAAHPLGPVESIAGFDSIKDEDREELRELEKNHKTDQTVVRPLEEPSPKKIKTHMSSPAKEELSDKASVSVEYAKSGRSTCKGCSENIAKGALRLGAAFHDTRGFDNTKWYHVACFPVSSYPVFPVENLEGFGSIEDHDCEKLRELEEDHKRDGNASDQLNEPNRSKKMHHKTDETAASPLEGPSPKKVKTQMSSPVEGVSDKASISVEYAKSGRSICKGCSENIAKGVLRLGASVHDPRGFENTKWYHVVCFPASSYQVFPVENLKGFDSIKDHDREKLWELEENHKRGIVNEPILKNEMAHSKGDTKEVTEKNLEEVKNHKRDEAAVDPLDDPSPKKVKAHLSSVSEGVSEKTSVSVEYAKSGRSTCKGCSENITNGALRIGASAHDPRGYDITKWYHVACFPASTYPIFPVENLKGFDSIESHDREKLRELEEGQKRDGNVADHSNEPSL